MIILKGERSVVPGGLRVTLQMRYSVPVPCCLVGELVPELGGLQKGEISDYV